MITNQNDRHCGDATCAINYVICIPGGNDTALVYGSDYTQEQKKRINDAIMHKHSNVEQVGFVDLTKEPELQMAGGEFCGNATRSAANLYLHGDEGSLQIVVNGSDVINAGVDDKKNAWCEIPLYYGDDQITQKEEGIYIVKMNGMISVVIQEDVAAKYITSDKDLQKQIGMDFIRKYELEFSEAVGVMLCESVEGTMKINPVVWVKSIDTLFNETACGSGTTAVAMVKAFLEGTSQSLDVIQPSGMTITANITVGDGKIQKAVISGPISMDGVTYSLNV